jgi:hypothetical protein
LFLLAPANLVFPGDAILYLSLSERLLARLLTGSYFLFTTAWLGSGETGSAIAAIISGALALMTSKFARQALLFTSPLFALFALDVRPVAALAGSTLVAMACEGRFFLVGLGDQVEFSRAYARYTKHGRLFSLGLSRFVDCRRVFDSTVPLRARLTNIQRQEPFQLLFRSPETGLLAMAALLWGEVSSPVVALLASTLCVYLLTSTPGFRHLGEAIRYAEYNLAFAAPAALAHALVVREARAAVAVLLIVSSLAIALSLWIHRHHPLPRSDGLQVFLRRCGFAAPDLVLCIPINLAPAISARTGVSTICYPGNYGVWMFEEYVEEYPFPKRDWRGIALRHGVTKLVVDKQALVSAKLSMGWDYDLTGLEIIADDVTYVCYGVEKAVHPSNQPSHVSLRP